MINPETLFQKSNLLKTTIICILLTAASIPAQTPDKAKIVAGAEKVLSKVTGSQPKNAPGCAVGISREGEPVYQKAFGMAELEHNVADHRRFRI